MAILDKIKFGEVADYVISNGSVSIETAETFVANLSIPRGEMYLLLYLRDKAKLKLSFTCKARQQYTVVGTVVVNKHTITILEIKFTDKTDFLRQFIEDARALYEKRTDYNWR